MTSDDFRKWRTDLKLTQEETGKRFGLSRYTIQNWENGTTQIPSYVPRLIYSFGREIKQQRNDFPVKLFYYTDTDFLLMQKGGLPLLKIEDFPNNTTMLRRVHEIIRSGSGLFLASVVEKENIKNIIWTQHELEEEIS